MLQDMKWLEFERNNWRLVQCLYQHRMWSSVAEGADLEENADVDMAVDIVRAPSEKEIIENFYKTNSEIKEAS